MPGSPPARTNSAKWRTAALIHRLARLWQVRGFILDKFKKINDVDPSGFSGLSPIPDEHQRGA
jgi:hypothetical protein